MSIEEKKMNQSDGLYSEAITVNSFDDRRKAQKQLVEELKAQWKLLWSERFDDKLKGEGVSVDEYVSLRVERGTIIHATRDYRALNFREILEEHRVENPDRFVQPDNNVGGWNKFIKTQIIGLQPQTGKRAARYVPEKRESQRPKKSGRGWLHAT